MAAQILPIGLFELDIRIKGLLSPKDKIIGGSVSDYQYSIKGDSLTLFCVIESNIEITDNRYINKSVIKYAFELSPLQEIVAMDIYQCSIKAKTVLENILNTTYGFDLSNKGVPIPIIEIEDVLSHINSLLSVISSHLGN